MAYCEFSMKARHLFLFTVTSLGTLLTGSAQAQVLRVFDPRPAADFQLNTQKVIQGEWSVCTGCKLINMTPYDAKGLAVIPQNPELAFGPLETWDLSQSPTVFLVNWNSLMKPEYAAWAQYLENLKKSAVPIVFAAGQPAAGETSAPLSKTLAGSVSGLFIIGELGESDRLWGASYYGPEILTALRPPKDFIGRDTVPAQFAAALTKNLNKKKDWLQILRDKKAKTRKIWLELRDCFGQ